MGVFFLLHEHVTISALGTWTRIGHPRGSSSSRHPSRRHRLRQGIRAEKAMDCTILLEQYLDGGEVDVDVVMSGGEWRYAAVTDNGPTLEPYFNAPRRKGQGPW